MKNLLSTVLFSVAILTGIFAQKKETLFIDTDKFDLISTTNSLVKDSKNYRILESFRKEAVTDVRQELNSRKYIESNVQVSDRNILIKAYRVSSDNGVIVRNKNGKVNVENEMEIGANTNSVISGELIYSESRKVDVVMKLYIRKDQHDLVTDKVVFTSEKINAITMSRSMDFLEEEDKAERLVRKMTRKLLGKGFLTKTGEYVVTGSGIVLTGLGTALFLNSNSRYQTYKDYPYVLDPVYDRFKNEEKPRQAYYESLKRTETMSYITGGLGIVLTAFGTYEIILDKKRSGKIYDVVNSNLRTDNSSKPQHTLTISSDINYNPITTQTNPQLKLTYRF